MIKKIKIKIYQKIANFFISQLKQTNNDKIFDKLYMMAFEFNNYCVEQDIYLN